MKETSERRLRVERLENAGYQARSRDIPPPEVWSTTGYGFRWYYIGTFVDNVRRYPWGDDWIEVVW